MKRSFFVVVVALAALGSARAQIQMQDSGTIASLRGIHSVEGTVAWASGTEGTVLRTSDGGAHWQKCAVPPGGEKLDFRGVWAWNANEGVVMSSGPGDQSRLYRTVDGCSHWTEDARNSEKDGFWDSLVFQARDFGMLGDERTGVLIGDPVRGRFQTEVLLLGHGWFIDDSSCKARPGEAAFAASNSSVFVFGSRRYMIGTGGTGGSRILISPLLAYGDSVKDCLDVPVPMAGGSDSAGVFSLAFRDLKHGVAVGGDYKNPYIRKGTAAWTDDGGRHWAAAAAPPHGYRSAVAWDNASRAWIAVGTNGSDVSRDDGRTWRHLDDGNWNAISLPFVVGPRGRIGKLDVR
jgi:photosystem II stability/assembly factor-like uncharacterized protein